MYACMRYPVYLRPFVLLTFAALYFLPACSLVEDLDKIKEPDWHPEIAVALINSRISLAEILDKFDTGEYLTTDGTGMLTVVYEDPSVYTATTAGMLTLPDVAFPMPDAVLFAPAPSQQGERLDRLVLNGGSLDYAFVSPYSGLMRVQIFLPGATRDGQSFVQTLTFTGPAARPGSLDLSGYALAFPDELMELRYRATIISTGETVQLDNFVLGLTGLSYAYAEGYLGRYEFALESGSMELGFFDLWQDGGWQFQEPSLELRIANTAGVPIRLRAGTLDAGTASGAISIVTPALYDGIPLTYPGLSEVGQTGYTTVRIDHNNSDLPAALAARPHTFAFDFEAVAFGEEDPAQTGFITKNSAINVALTARLPLYASVADISIRDTFEMKLEDVDRLSSAGFRMITENGFPLDMALQIYFLDAQYQVIDSLQSGKGIALSAAGVDATDRATTPAKDIQEVQVENQRLDALKRAAWISYRASIASPQGGSVPVRLYDHYELAIKLGVKAGL